MITVVAKTTMTPLKIRNLAVFEATTSPESWLIAAGEDTPDDTAGRESDPRDT
jgi:hypothetical protein